MVLYLWVVHAKKNDTANLLRLAPIYLGNEIISNYETSQVNKELASSKAAHSMYTKLGIHAPDKPTKSLDDTIPYCNELHKKTSRMTAKQTCENALTSAHFEQNARAPTKTKSPTK